MTDTTFVDKTTVVTTAWLNDANKVVYRGAANVTLAPYGAVGDGVTDDTVAIQAAIDGGLPLFFPPLTYLITGTLTKANSAIPWFGYGATLKKNTTGTLLKIGLLGTVSRMDTIELGGLTFRSAGNTGGQTIGVDVVDSTPASQQNICFRNARFIGFTKSSTAKPANTAIVQADYSKAWYKGYQYSAFIAQTDTPEVRPDTQGIGCRVTSNVWTVEFDNVFIEGCNIGFVSVGSVNDYIKFKNASIISCGAAVVIKDSNNFVFEGTCEYNYSGIWLFGVKHFTIADGTQMEGNDLHHVYAGQGTSRICQIGRLGNVNLQPLSGARANQINALYMPGVDTLSIEGTAFNGSTTVQTAEKGWDLFFGTDTYRVFLDARYEASDGFIQINDTTKLSSVWRKSTGTATYTINVPVTFGNRCSEKQGSGIAAANNLSLPVDGNYQQISGATQINLLDSTSWQGGSVVTLKFSSTPTVKHNQVASTTYMPIMLAGAVDFVATANDMLTLRYDSTDSKWYEMCRTVI